MTDQEKLDLLNSMEFEEVDSEYVLVEYNEKNLSALKKVVPNIEKYLNEHGDPDNSKEVIEISCAAFMYANCDFWTGSKFVIVSKDELIEMYIRETEKVAELNYRLKEIGEIASRINHSIGKVFQIASKK